MITQTERDRRLSFANTLMKNEQLSALLIIGNGSAGGSEYGHYRYFVNNRVYYHMQALIAVADDYPSVCCGSPTHLNALKALNFNDIYMVGDRIIEGIISILEKRSVTSGRIGFCPDQIPTSWYDKLTAALPELQLVDISALLYRIRANKSPEEQALVRRSTELAERSYRSLVQADLVGSTENFVSAELDYSMKFNGAEESMARLALGRPGEAKESCSYLHHAANSQRKIAAGDCLSLEISPRLEGYWAQITRTVCIGKPTDAAQHLFSVARDCLNKGASLLRPGTKLKAIAEAISSTLEANGCISGQRYGGVCGIDFLELPITPDSEAVLLDGMPVVLKVEAAPSHDRTGILLGEIYQVTPNGGIQLDKREESLFEYPERRS